MLDKVVAMGVSHIHILQSDTTTRSYRRYGLTTCTKLSHVFSLISRGSRGCTPLHPGSCRFCTSRTPLTSNLLTQTFFKQPQQSVFSTIDEWEFLYAPIIFTFLSFFTRMHRIGLSPIVTWDEAQYVDSLSSITSISSTQAQYLVRHVTNCVS